MVEERTPNKHILAFLAEIEKRQEKPRRKLAKEHNSALADIEKRQEPDKQALAKAQRELEEARTWLENIPVDAEPGEIATRQVVVDRWPARIKQINDALGVFYKERRQVETQFSYDVRHLDNEIYAAIHEAKYELERGVPSVQRFIS